MFRYQRLLRGFTLLLFGSSGAIGNPCRVELVGCLPLALPAAGMESKRWICILASLFGQSRFAIVLALASFSMGLSSGWKALRVQQG